MKKYPIDNMWKERFNHYYERFVSGFDRFSSKYSIIYSVFRGILFFGILSVIAFGFFFFIVYLGFYGDLPKKDELKDIKNHVASEVYSADGVLLGKYFIENRTTTTFDRISKNVMDALVATEDVRFYDHSGVDIRSIFRVIFKTLIGQDESSGGGSTLTQQLAKNLYPRKDYGFLSLPINKMRETIIAYRLEKVYSKSDIITLYLNTVSFGENAFGIETATHRYFSVPPDRINLEQASVLIGMLKATSAYNPRLNPSNSKLRRNVVINQLKKYDYINDQEADSLKRLPLQLEYSSYTHVDGLAPYFREFLRGQLDKWVQTHKKPDGSKYNIYTDGLKIHTSIDSRMQQYAEDALHEHMSELQETFRQHWFNRNPWGKNEMIIKEAMRRTERYRIMKQEGLEDEEIYKRLQDSLPMTIFKYEGEIAKYMSPLDSIKYYQMLLNSGFMAMEPESGYVKAWVGGIDFKYFKYDQILAQRSVGSTFKPIVYSAAIESGIDPCERISNYRQVYQEYDGWSPRNADNKYGGSYSLQAALTSSVNVVSVKLIMETGVNKTVNLAKSMGITSELLPYPSIALGAADVSLYEMISAYTTFANRGLFTSPIFVTRIEDANGNILEDYTHTANQRKVLSTETADIMVQMLQNVVDDGTGRKLRYRYGFKNEIAGKTGTTQNHVDGWFIGFTPGLVAGARVGAEDQRIHFRTLSLGQGSTMALPIWGNFMKKVYDDSTFAYLKEQKFPEPSKDVLDRLECPPVVYYSDDSYDEDQPFWQFLLEQEEPAKKSSEDNNSNTDDSKKNE